MSVSAVGVTGTVQASSLAYLEARLQRAVEKLPAEKEIPSLLKRVAGLGQEADLDVTLFKPGTAVATKSERGDDSTGRILASPGQIVARSLRNKR